MNNPTVALKTSTCLGIIYNIETIRYSNNSASNTGHNAQLLLSQITYIMFHNLSSSFSLVLIQIIYFNIAFTIAIMNMHQGLCQYSNHQTVLKRFLNFYSTSLCVLSIRHSKTLDKNVFKKVFIYVSLFPFI